jgi:cytochrome P450
MSDASEPGGRGLRTIPHVWLFLRYVRRLIRARRARPQEDLVSALVQAEEAGQHKRSSR